VVATTEERQQLSKKAKGRQQEKYYRGAISQISYSLVVILELSGVSEVQYKEIIITGNE